MVRVGIVGFGFMGQTHWRCYERLRGSASVVAIADSDPRRVKGDISGTWGNLGDGAQRIDLSSVAAMTDWRELVSMSKVDVVDVCVPTPYHREVIEAAFAAGKHVLCEKPLARTLSDATSIAAAATETQCFLMPAMCMRFWPQWAWLKQAVSDHRYGDVHSAQFLRQGTMPPGWYGNGEISGGALLDLHIHDTDFVCYLFGKPQAVSSRGYRGRSGCVDHVSTQYHYEDIPVVVVEGSWTFAPPWPFRMRYTVHFEGDVTADFDLGRPNPLVVYEGGQARPVECEPVDGWFGSIRYFVDCVSASRRPTTVTADDAILALRVIEAEQRSIVNNSTSTL